jgi:hypothetical protein
MHAYNGPVWEVSPIGGQVSRAESAPNGTRVALGQQRAGKFRIVWVKGDRALEYAEYEADRWGAARLSAGE